jgi:hypothetical protein
MSPIDTEDLAATGLLAKLGHHGLRQLDPSHRHTPGVQGERDPTSPNREFQGWPATCPPGEEIDRRAQDFGCIHVSG